jgi:hypothetical protein
MKPFVDRATLEQTSFDSALPSGTAAVVHRFQREGRYAVALSPDGKQVVETRTIYVEHPRADAAAARAEGAKPRDIVLEPPRPFPEHPQLPQAIELDVSRSATLAGAAAADADQIATPQVAGLVTGGYASFTAPTGGAHHVVITRIGADGEQEKEFDSTRLGATDAFAITLFRPGTYAMRNAVGGREGRLVVHYPQIGRTAYRPAEPVTVAVHERGFEPGELTIGPGQGVIFQVAAESRITVELLEPDDGPGDAGRKTSLATRRVRPLVRPGSERLDPSGEGSPTAGDGEPGGSI